MKILHIINELFYGGAARALMVCADRCSKMEQIKHTVVSLAPISTKASISMAANFGIDVVETPQFETLSSLIECSDIVHVHYWNGPNINDFFYMPFPPMRLLMKINIGGYHPPHVITRDIVDFADIIQTTGPFAHDHPVFNELDPETRLSKVRMSYGAADFSRLSVYRPKPHKGFNVTYIGTVDFEKMHPDFVDLSCSVRVPDARFLVCGFGGAYSTLEQQALNKGALDRFHFKREQENISDILSVTDVFGYPLCEDNYSSGELVLQEVAYAGIPAVVFPYGGAGRLVINDFTGFVVRSAPEYREAIEHLWHNPKDRHRLGRNARAYAEQLFGEQNAACKTLAMYASLMKMPKRSRRFGQRKSEGTFSAIFDPHPDCIQATASPGVQRFLHSLGASAPWFEHSLKADLLETQGAADERVASSSVVIIRTMFRYRDFYPADGWLCYWCGLVQYQRGEHLESAVSCFRAMKNGCHHWGAWWLTARCAYFLGDMDMSVEALHQVITLASHFQNAHEMLEKIVSNRGVVSCLTPEVMRLRRWRACVAAQFTTAEETGRNLLEHFSGSVLRDDIEAYYKIGLEAQKAGQEALAVRIYQPENRIKRTC